MSAPAGHPMSVRFARWLLGCAVRYWPEETRAWGMALAAETDETASTLEALRWSWGGIMLFARSVVASASTWLKLPAGASLPGKAEPSGTPVLPRRSRLFTAGALVAAVFVLLLPLGRQARTMVGDSWNEFRLSASERRELDKLAARAEKENDAATLAFVALRVDDPGRYSALADRAVSLNPDLVWIYGAGHNHWARLTAPEQQGLESLRVSDPDNAVPVLLAADAVAQRSLDEEDKHRSRAVNREVLLASNSDWMALMETAFIKPRYDSYEQRHAQLISRVWNRERYLSPSVVIEGLWARAIPNLLNQRVFSNIQIREAEKAAAAGDWNKAERLLGEVESFGERVAAANSTKIEKLIGLAIERDANHARVKLYTGAGQTAEAQKAGLLIQQIDDAMAALRPSQGREQTFRRWGILLQWVGGLAAISGFAALVAILLLELLPARLGSRKWRRALCRTADYAPATFLGASAVFLLSFLPYAHVFAQYFSWSNGIQNEELISDALMGLGAVPQYVLEPVRLVIWFSVLGGLAALAIFIVGRGIYRGWRVQAKQS